MRPLMIMMLALLGIAATGCENVQRSLVFTTGTTLGVEVSASPQTDAPVKLLIGYKRAEVLFDPIMEDAPSNHVSGGNGASGQPSQRRYTIKDQPHSVLAKLLGAVSTEAKTGTGPEAKAGVTVAQWFAAGEPAEILARNGGAAALTDDPNVAAKIVEGMRIGGGLGTAGSSVALALMNGVYLALGEEPLADDPEAMMHRQKLNDVADALVTNEERALARKYIWNDPVLEIETDPFKPKDSNDIQFEEMIGLVAMWKGAAENLDLAASSLGNAGLQIDVDSNGAAAATDAQRSQAIQDLMAYRPIFEAFDRKVRSHPDVVAAVEFYRNALLGTDN